MSIKHVLENAKENNIMVSAYDNTDNWGQHTVGYVDLVTNIHVRFRALSKYGEAAEFEIRLLSDIFKVEYGGKYETKQPPAKARWV